MKKILSLVAITLATLTVTLAQKNVFNATAYSEKESGKWRTETASKTTITVNQTDSFIEISGDDPEIFQITKVTTSTEDGAQVTEFSCSDNEANECIIKLAKGDSDTKIYFVYANTEFYYVVK